MNIGIDVWACKETISDRGLSGYRIHEVEPLKQFKVAEFTILPFPIEHDVEGLGYLIKTQGIKALFLTDSFYCKYKFNSLNFIMIECNYIIDTLNANVEAGYIPEEMKKRLIQSHFSLENVKKFLKANDLSQCRKIILLHLSDNNSDAKRMVQEIEALTGIETVVADAGMEIDLELYPY